MLSFYEQAAFFQLSLMIFKFLKETRVLPIKQELSESETTC